MYLLSTQIISLCSHLPGSEEAVAAMGARVCISEPEQFRRAFHRLALADEATAPEVNKRLSLTIKVETEQTWKEPSSTHFPAASLSDTVISPARVVKRARACAHAHTYMHTHPSPEEMYEIHAFGNNL